MSSRIVTLFSILLLVSCLMACNGKGGGGSVVEQTQQLNTDVNAHWDGIMQTFDSIEANIELLAKTPEDVKAEVFDINEVKDMLDQCFNAPIELAEQAGDAAGGGDVQAASAYGRDAYAKVKGCASMDRIDNYKGGASAAVGSFVEEKVTAIDNLRKDIYYIQEAAENTPEYIADWTLQIGEILATAEASAAAMMLSQDEYNQVQTQLTSLQDSFMTMGQEASEFPTRIQGLLQRIEQDMKSFGTGFTNM